MLDWLDRHEELLIALFGAGGAGVVLLTALLHFRRGGEPSDKVVTTADNGGLATTNTGSGSVVVTVNEAVREDTIHRLQARLGVEALEATNLLIAFRQAGLGVAQGEEAVGRMSDPALATLVSVLRQDDVNTAALLVKGAALPRGQG